MTTTTIEQTVPIKPKQKRRPKGFARDPLPRIAYTVDEFCKATSISRPVVYRMMREGQLHFVQLGERFRRIPASEVARLGLVDGGVA
jgi:excisionase family DNA binding protein